MQKHWIDSNAAFLDYVGVRFYQSVKASLIAGELVVTEVDESLLPRFHTKEDMKKHLEDLEYWQKELYHQTRDDYRHFSYNIRKDLSIVYRILYSLC